MTQWERWLFSVTIFVSAFLVFQVQPIIARFILPWYGGSASVWTTALLFFQSALLAGYAHAYVLSRFGGPLRQGILHAALLALSLLTLPIAPAESLKPLAGQAPQFSILWLLLRSVGFPFFLLAATSSLLQHWIGSSQAGRAPYRLYALSNLGSLLGLILYPLLVEPRWDLSRQSSAWSLAYGFFAVLCGASALRLGWRSRRVGIGDALADGDAASSASARAGDAVLWLLLSACGSVLLLSITNKMCQDVAVVPFLWVLPLALYLITFIIAFDRGRWYRRWFWGAVLVASIIAIVFLLRRDFGGAELPLSRQILIYMGALFAGCMVCHGELVRLKPPLAGLTRFYLLIALGGALGGLFVNSAAPLIFPGYWELHLALIATPLLFGVCILRDRASPRSAPFWIAGSAWIGGLVVLGALLLMHIVNEREDVLTMKRNFFGVLRVLETRDSTGNLLHTLSHGRIRHGWQYVEPPLRDFPGLYYGPDSGVGISLRYRSEDPTGETADDSNQPPPVEVGVIGLGVGTVAAYAQPEDHYVFYEINPAVLDYAREYFSYLPRAEERSHVSVILGDARVSLERELATRGSRQFDVLVLDAFNGDAVPVHLLTAEAFELYGRHLKPDGILAIHISNYFLDLSDVVRRNAEVSGRYAVLCLNESDPRHGVVSSEWVLVTRNRDFYAQEGVTDHLNAWPRKRPRDIHWTDAYSNLLQVLKR